MKVHKSITIVVFACLLLSLAVTLASYSFSYMEPDIVDAAFVYRGWPLHWIVESWSYWSTPPYPHAFDFQPLNFTIDFVFWTAVFQLPPLFYFFKRSQKRSKCEQHMKLSVLLLRYTPGSISPQSPISLQFPRIFIKSLFNCE